MLAAGGIECRQHGAGAGIPNVQIRRSVKRAGGSGEFTPVRAEQRGPALHDKTAQPFQPGNLLSRGEIPSTMISA